MKARIALLSDRETGSLVKKYSALISSKQSTLFTLDDLHIPHVTVAHITFDEGQFEEIVRKIKKIALGQKKICVRTNEVKRVLGTFIGVYFADEKEIITLREEIVKNIKENISKVDPYFPSHITLTRMQYEKCGEEAVRLIQDFPFGEVSLDTIIIGDSCENGTVSEILSHIPLK